MKSDRDYLEIIGTTHTTSNTGREKRSNSYYHKTYKKIVRGLLREQDTTGTVFDIGTSHGHWLPFFNQLGFSKKLGIELDAGRAELARAAGYDEVFLGDAAKIPQPDNTVDLAISNDVFVHILKIEDKLAVIKEVQRILKNGGVFILNHTMSKPLGFTGYTVDDYCSYLDLDNFLRLFEGTELRVVDVKPTYFNFRKNKTLWGKVLAGLVRLPIPFGPQIKMMLDDRFARVLSLEDSDVVYLKAIKTV